MIDIHRLKEHIYDVVGALYEVHKELGAGLNEYCYQEGLHIQLEESNIPFEKELTFHPSYHGQPMNALYRVDFVCKGEIIIECKSVEVLNNNHRAQLFNYMRLLNATCGILVNFAPKNIDLQRYFFDIEQRDILDVYGRLVHKYRQ
ncbi:MAG: GxxExxY protein [Muribaculaceae bacterium]|nr:GxxExxY protein [Muribaculaceae bacterium]